MIPFKYDSTSYKCKKWYYIYISHNYAKVKVDPYDSLYLEKTMTVHVIIPIKSVFNKDKNSCYYNIFLEKVLYE